MLKIFLFGSPRVELDGRTLHLKRRKALALLVYLAVTRRAHNRDALATLFYPEYDQSRARAYFRRDLGVVNSELVGGWVEADHETAALGQIDQIWVDTAEFHRHAAANDSSRPAEALSHLAAAANLYKDDFLAGFSLPDCPEFDEWQFFEAEKLRQALAGVLKNLVQHLEGQAAYEQAIPHALRLVNLDPLSEPAQRQLMRLYTLNNRQSAALRQYDLLVDLLDESLGVPPEPETVELYEAIKARQPLPGPAPSPEPEPAKTAAIDPWPPSTLAAPTIPDSVPFVGRRRELQALQAALSQAQSGQGQIRFVTGEAGQGKSTLIQAFARQVLTGEDRLHFARGYCNAITGLGDPYLPFREILVMLTGDEQAWAKQLRALAGQSGAEIDQAQIFAQYTAYLKAVAEKRPLLLVLEDLHWIDNASSGLLFHLSRELADSRILLLGTYRPEELLTGHPMTPHPMRGILSELKRTHGDIWLDLGRQNSDEDRQFVDDYLDLRPNRLGDQFRQALFKRTGGQALFTAELLRTLEERGDLQQGEDGLWAAGADIDWQTLPAKVEGVIEKRIERLDEELQAILTAASVEGAVFSAEVVARIQQLEERLLVLKLSRELDKRHQLIEAQEIKWLRSGQQRLSLYRFRHNLFQNYLYHHLDEVECGYLHEAVGRTLEQLYDDPREVAGQLAYHFQRAGQVSKAIEYAEMACETALIIHAYDEAVVHISRAVELAEKVGAGAEKLAPLYVRLGGLLLITKGDGAPEVGQAYQRAYDLSEQQDQTSIQFEALRGLAQFQRHRMETGKARQLTREMCDLSQRLQDRTLIIEASFALGSQAFFSGDHEEAQVNLERAVATYDRAQHQALAHRHGQDPGVASLSYAAINSWMLGYPDQARDYYTQAIALAAEIDHAYSETMARNWAAWTSVFRRDPDSVLEHAGAAIRLSEKHNFPLFLAIGTCHYGWALGQKGEMEQAIAQMEQGLAEAVLAWGSELGAPPFLALLAETYAQFGQPDAGRHCLDRAFTLIDQIPEQSWAESELYRLRGELSAAEADLLQAIQIAQAQSAKSLELRAVVTLAQLWQSQGKQAQAREILEETYGWFTEGFETADLQQARALLEELSNPIIVKNRVSK